MTAPIIEGAEPWSAAGGDAGVLVVHGFTGNPQSMRPVAEALAAAGLTVELPLLPGHGTSVADMLETSWPDWLGAAEEAYADLASRCSRVAVVGLSMGGAITVWLASEHPEIAGIACLNAVVSAPEGMREAIEGLIAAGDEVMVGIGSDIAKEGVVEAAYADTPLRPLLTLFDAAAELESRLGLITCPVLVVNSPQDHVVGPENSDILASSVSGPVERVTAPDSYHVVTLDIDGPAVAAAVTAFCTKVLAPEDPLLGPEGDPPTIAAMPPRISRDDVAHVARLARLALDDDELTTFTDQLAAVLDHAADVEALDLADVEPTAHPLPIGNVMRADEVGATLSPEDVLAAAPHAESGRFRVPPILGEAP